MNDISKKELLERLNKKLVKGDPDNPLYIRNAEIEDINIEGVIFENVILDRPAIAYARFDKAIFRNVVFKNCISMKFRSDYAVMDNVVFDGCMLKSFNPMGVTFSDAVFRNTAIDSASFAGAKGTLKLEKSNLKNADIGDTEISWTINDSRLTKIKAYGIQGSITLTNSTLKDANFEFGKMDSFESYNSVVDALAPGTINEKLIIQGGHVDFTGLIHAPSVEIDGAQIKRFSMRRGKASRVIVRNCKEAGVLGFSLTKLDSLEISDCAIEYLGMLSAHVDVLRLNNVSIAEEWESEGANYQSWYADNLTLSGKLEFQKSQVLNKHFNNVTLSDTAKLDSSGANFSFTD